MSDETPAVRTFARVVWPVRTARLRLRPIEDGDLHGLFAIRSQPEVSLWLSGTATSYDAFAEEWHASDRFDTVLAVKQGDRLVGDVFLRVTDAWSQREVRPQALGTQGEIGWLVDPAYAGRGIATEAAAALLAVCFETLGLRRVTAAAFADNAASLRVMEKLGMRIEGRGVREALHRERGWVDGVSAALLADEWRVNRIDRP